MLYQFKGIKEGHIWVLQMRAMYHDVCKNKTFLTSMNVTVVRNPLFECFVNLNITQRFHSCTLRSNNYWYSLLQCTYISKSGCFFSLFATCIKYIVSLLLKLFYDIIILIWLIQWIQWCLYLYGPCEHIRWC